MNSVFKQNSRNSRDKELEKAGHDTFFREIGGHSDH